MSKGIAGSDNINKGVSVRKAKFFENAAIFRCPVCMNKMEARDLNRIICLNVHFFDISMNGYINFLQRTVKTEYHEEMFRSRKTVSGTGLFDPMLRCISDMILSRIRSLGDKRIMILDAGCGEGSHLGKIISELHNKDITKVLGAGIDISKEGIIMASKTYHDIVWCVADLANLPFMDKQFDVIINILSPSNYREFTRVLKDDGILIKVIPGSSYLKELRDIFYNESGKQEYSNHNVLELYRQNFSILDVRAVKYNKIVGKDELSHIIAMTPLSWAITHEKKEQALITGISRITGDFAIIKGTKKGR